jgi:hypothetical protein
MQKILGKAQKHGTHPRSGLPRAALDQSAGAVVALPAFLRALSRAFTRLPASVLDRLKRIDSLPVSTMWQWWVRRSSKAVVGVIKQTRTGSGATLNVATQLGYVYADHLNSPRVIARGSPSTDHRIVWRWDATEPFGLSPANENPNGAGAYSFNRGSRGRCLIGSRLNTTTGTRISRLGRGGMCSPIPSGSPEGSIPTHMSAGTR